MKMELTALWANLLLAATCCGGGKEAAVNRELIVCGWDEVFILDYAKLDADGKPAKTWSWKAAERQDLPEAFRGKFATTDECKPDANGSNILVTASSGGIAVVRRADGAVRFHAAGSNVHSADWLPNGRIAVAMSVCSRGEGDRLTLFDLGRPNAPLQHEPLPGGHGAVWDGKRHLLWALSSVDIRVFRLESWDTDAPRLVKIETIPLPEGGGHDFFPVPDSDDLTVTTSGHVWLFNRADKAFRKHPVLGDVRHVKCVNRHPVTGRTVYVKADEPNWWSASLRFLEPEGDYTVPGEHFYKARWNSR